MGNRKIEDMLLYEVRENRRAIQEVENKHSKLDKDVFSNKIKLAILITVISLFSSITVIRIAEKLKTYFT